MPARWIADNEREKAELLGYNVVEPVAVLATHLTEVINQHAHELLGRQETQHLLDELKQTYPSVVEELVPDTEAVGKLQRVLQGLLAELTVRLYQEIHGGPIYRRSIGIKSEANKDDGISNEARTSHRH